MLILKGGGRGGVIPPLSETQQNIGTFASETNVGQVGDSFVIFSRN